MSLVNEQDLFLRHVAMLINKVHLMGYQVTGGELWRTPEQQEIYFKNGKSKTLTASKHLNRLAIDLNFFKDGKLIVKRNELFEIGNYWEGLDDKNKWGGNWTSIVDTPHFERQV